MFDNINAIYLSITMKNKKYQNNSYIHVAIVIHGSEFLNRKI